MAQSDRGTEITVGPKTATKNVNLTPKVTSKGSAEWKERNNEGGDRGIGTQPNAITASPTGQPETPRLGAFCFIALNLNLQRSTVYFFLPNNPFFFFLPVSCVNDDAL